MKNYVSFTNFSTLLCYSGIGGTFFLKILVLNEFFDTGKSIFPCTMILKTDLSSDLDTAMCNLKILDAILIKILSRCDFQKLPSNVCRPSQYPLWCPKRFIVAFSKNKKVYLVKISLSQLSVKLTMTVFHPYRLVKLIFQAGKLFYACRCESDILQENQKSFGSWSFGS